MLAFLRKLRLRLRVVWVLATATLVAPFVAGASLFLVVLGFVRPYSWPEVSAWLVVVAVGVAILLSGFAQRLPVGVVARSADRGLATRDAFGAALQFDDLAGPFGERIRTRAENLSLGALPKNAAPLPHSPRRWLVAGVLGLGAVGLAFAPNPQDDVRADQAREQARIDAVADELEEQAEALSENPDTAQVGADLQELVDELRQAEDLEAAEEILAKARELLEQARPQDFASRQAAVNGLERSVAERPLAAGTTVEEQLAALAEALESATPEEMEAAAERLEDLAETQAAGNPGGAAALGDAAAAIRSGDVAGAQAALGEAAGAQAAGQAALDADAATGAALEAVKAAEGQLGQGEGQGQGQGEGQGEGQGQGQGGSGAQGEVGGAQGGTGEGQGGVGTPGGTDQPRIVPDDATIVDPLSLNAGEEVDLGGSSDGSPGEVVGKADGPTTAGPVRVPVSELVGDYAERATATASRDQLAPSQVELVGDYFDLLSQ